MRFFCRVAATCFLLSTAGLFAQVHTPRITNERLPDYTELGRFVKFSQWRNLPPPARMDRGKVRQRARSLAGWLTGTTGWTRM